MGSLKYDPNKRLNTLSTFTVKTMLFEFELFPSLE